MWYVLVQDNLSKEQPPTTNLLSPSLLSGMGLNGSAEHGERRVYGKRGPRCLKRARGPRSPNPSLGDPGRDVRRRQRNSWSKNREIVGAGGSASKANVRGIQCSEGWERTGVKRLMSKKSGRLLSSGSLTGCRSKN